MHSINPKAHTNDRLFGFFDKSTREWVDGLAGSLLRKLAIDIS